MFYLLDTHRYVQDNFPARGGEIELRQGNYQMVMYNNVSEKILFRNLSDYGVIEAYTNKVSRPLLSILLLVRKPMGGQMCCGWIKWRALGLRHHLADGTATRTFTKVVPLSGTVTWYPNSFVTYVISISLNVVTFLFTFEFLFPLIF